MIFSRDRILTTHVGSLPRNDKLSDLLMTGEDGKSFRPGKQMADEMDNAVRHVVAKHAEAGIDVGNDGEQQRVGFQTYVPQRMSGFAGESKRPARAATSKSFPSCSKFQKRRVSNRGSRPAERAGGARRAQIPRYRPDQGGDRALQEGGAGQVHRDVHDRALARHHRHHHAQCVLRFLRILPQGDRARDGA